MLSSAILRAGILACGAAAVPLISVPAPAQGPLPLGELFASDTSGQKSMQLAGSGMAVVSGSDLSAGIAPATLRLFRGGQVRICPRSGLNVSAAGSGIVLATGAGAVEIDYQLTQQAADVLITPDLNVMMVGPGVFHFALGVSRNGDTCVKPLPGNTTEIGLSELLGTDTYKVPPDEAILFAGGKLAARSPLSRDCGCPPVVPAMKVETAPVPTPPAEKPATVTAAEATGIPSNEPDAAPPTDRSGQLHVQVDTPFVFSGRTGVAPYSVARLQFSSLPNVFFLQEKIDPIVLQEEAAEVSLPAQKTQTGDAPKADAPKKVKKGFFGRVKGFFGSLFHR